MQVKSNLPENIMPSETNTEPQGETLHHATADYQPKRTEAVIT